MTDWYDTAQICLNGHVINSSSVLLDYLNRRFCDKCGAATITNCPHCDSRIRGHYQLLLAISGKDDCKRPAFCNECGKPYPWTESKMRAAKELALELDLSIEEKTTLSDGLAIW